MRLPFVAAPGWWVGARCRTEQIDLALFFTKETVSEARKICSECLVRTRCLTDHLDEPFGVWGGHSKDERARLRSAVDEGANLEAASRALDDRRRTG